MINICQVLVVSQGFVIQYLVYVKINRQLQKITDYCLGSSTTILHFSLPVSKHWTDINELSHTTTLGHRRNKALKSKDKNAVLYCSPIGMAVQNQYGRDAKGDI